MSTRDNLSQLSEDELKALCQEKKAEFDQKMAINQRIRGILSRKMNEKQEAIDNPKKRLIIFLLLISSLQSLNKTSIIHYDQYKYRK